MKERPIPLKAWEVQAILAGRKTQMRRVVKPQPNVICQPTNPVVDDKGFIWHGNDEFRMRGGKACPFGVAGDRLWVKEAWRAGVEWDDVAPRDIDPLCGGNDIWYAAQGRVPEGYGRLRASIHMPRWASRILLEVVSVRVERVQDISLGDCVAEGIDTSGFVSPKGFSGNELKAAIKYAQLWDSINGDDSWAANPWVWVTEFKRIEVQP